MKKNMLLIGGVLIVLLIVLFGAKAYRPKPKTISPRPLSSAPVQLKEHIPDEGKAVENKQTSPSPQEENAEYEFPLNKKEPLLN